MITRRLAMLFSSYGAVTFFAVNALCIRQKHRRMSLRRMSGLAEVCPRGTVA